MNIVISAILLAVYGVSSSVNGDICTKEPQNVCIKPGMGPVIFPTSLGGLQTLCPTFLQILRCFMEYKNFCGSKAPRTLEVKFDEAYVLMAQACNKDSVLHLELGSSLECLKNLLMTHRNVCQPVVEAAANNRLESIGIFMDDENYAMKRNDDLRYYCLTDALQASCFIARTDVTCGDVAEHLVKHILSQVEYVETVCGEDMFDELGDTISYAHRDIEKEIATSYCQSWSVSRLCDRKFPTKNRRNPFF